LLAAWSRSALANQTMKIASVLLSLVMASMSAQAAVTAYDGVPGGGVHAFYDATNKLYWSNADALGAFTWTSADSAARSASFEGLTGWRLPTFQEFQKLYKVQGPVSSNDLRMWAGLDSTTNRPLLNIDYSVKYWTFDTAVGTTGVHVAYSPLTNLSYEYANSCCNGGSPHTWAVTSVTPVPEPETYAMLLAGLGVMGFIARRRKQR